MEIANLSAEPLGKLHSWLPHDLQAEQVVFLPDACPGKSPLPTGTAVLTRQSDWRKFAVSDCGCGMRRLRSSVQPKDLDLTRWNQAADSLRSNKGGLGDLGGGNHFLDAIAPYDDGPLHFLIHTGSRNESGHVDHLIAKPDQFDDEFEHVVNWGGRQPCRNSTRSWTWCLVPWRCCSTCRTTLLNNWTTVESSFERDPCGCFRESFRAAIAHVGRCSFSSKRRKRSPRF